MLIMSSMSRRALLASGIAAAIVKPAKAQGVAGFILGFLVAREANRNNEPATTTTPYYDPVLRQIEVKLSGNKALAAQVLKAIGPTQADAFLNDRLGLWVQFPGDAAQNQLKVRLHNNSMKPVHGQIEFAIDNVITKRREFVFADDGYRLDPQGTIETTIPLRVDFPSPGPRRVSIVNQPRSVSAPVCEIYVVPFNVA